MEEPHGEACSSCLQNSLFRHISDTLLEASPAFPVPWPRPCHTRLGCCSTALRGSPTSPFHPAARLTSRSTRHRDSPRAQPRDGPRSHVGREKVRVGAPARRLASRARFRFRPQVNLRSFHFGKTPCSRPTQLTPMHPFSGLSQRGPLLGGSQPPPPHRAAAIARAHGTPVSRPPGLPPGC